MSAAAPDHRRAIRAAIRTAVQTHKASVSRPVLRRIAMSVVAGWIGQQDGTVPANDAMVIAQEAIKFINTQFKAKATK